MSPCSCHLISHQERAVVHGWYSRQPASSLEHQTCLVRWCRTRSHPYDGSLGVLTRVFLCSIMILPQVHLRKPCYDFCFRFKPLRLKRFPPTAKVRKPPTAAVPDFSRNGSVPVVATGGVYKGQGRNQRELMTRTYWEFLVQGK